MAEMGVLGLHLDTTSARTALAAGKVPEGKAADLSHRVMAVVCLSVNAHDGLYPDEQIELRGAGLFLPRLKMQATQTEPVWDVQNGSRGVRSMEGPLQGGRTGHH